MEISSGILKLADALAERITNTDDYKEYMDSLEYIRQRPELMQQVQRLKKMHMSFAEHRAANVYSFDEEKYVSQEFYKLMLNKHVEDYFMKESKLVKLLNAVYCHLAECCCLDIFVGD